MKRIPKRSMRRSDEIPNVASLLRKGQEYFSAGDLDTAESCCRQIQKIDAQDVASALLLARIKYRQDKAEEALKILSVLNERLPDSPPILNDLAIVYSGQGDHAAALHTYERLMERTSTTTYLLLCCVKEHLALGQADEALRFLAQHESDMRPSLELSLIKADCLRSLKQFKAATDLLESESSRQPPNEDLFKQLVAIYREAEDESNFENALRRWLEVNPTNSVAQHLLLSITSSTQEPNETRASDQYVREVFNRFASSFEQSLTDLDYRAPTLVHDVIKQVLNGHSLPLSRVLDGGCGTGLCGTFLRSYSHILHGVDLSAGMLEEARVKSLYDELIEAELTTYLSQVSMTYESKGYDLIVVCDTVNYFGDLTHLIYHAFNALSANGWLIFTIETMAEDPNQQGYKLNPTGRYSHFPPGVESLLKKSGFIAPQSQDVILRRQADRDVLGNIFWAKAQKLT